MTKASPNIKIWLALPETHLDLADVLGVSATLVETPAQLIIEVDGEREYQDVILKGLIHYDKA